MDVETKTILEECQKELVQLREKVEKTPSPDVIDRAEIEKMDKSLSALEMKFDEQFSKLEIALKRRATAPISDEKAEEARMKTFRKAYNGEHLSEDEVKKCFGHREEYNSIEKKGLSVGDQSDGGFLVRPEFADQILKREFESSPIRNLAKKVQISTSEYIIPVKWGRMNSGWVGEKEARKETDTKRFQQITIQAHEIYAEPAITQTLLDDAAYNVEMGLIEDIREEFDLQEANAFVNGNGVKKPRGILSYEEGEDFGQLQRVKTGHATQITADSLVKLQNSLKNNFQGDARFLVRREAATPIRLLKDTQNRYLFSTDKGRLAKGLRPFMLLDAPLEYAHDLVKPDEAGAFKTNDQPVIYGNFMRGYCIVDRVGIRMIRDQYSAKPYILFYTTKRVGGGVTNFDALKILKVAA